MQQSMIISNKLNHRAWNTFFANKDKTRKISANTLKISASLKECKIFPQKISDFAKINPLRNS